MAITKFDKAQELFSGQGDLIMFDSITDYSAATFASLTNPKSLGQIVQDSTSWDGDDVSVDQIKDEQGNVITAKVTAGTVAFSFEIASTSKDMVKKFLQGADVTVTSKTLAGFSAPTAAVKFGTALPVFTAPIAILNDENSRLFLVPKAKITSNLSLSDGLWRIKASVLAENVDTTDLGTAMFVNAKVS